MTTKQLGNIGEAKALAKFVELQIPVYIPFGDNEKSDLIADFNGKLNKVQVKTSEEWIDSEKFVISLGVRFGICTRYYLYRCSCWYK